MKSPGATIPFKFLPGTVISWTHKYCRFMTTTRLRRGILKKMSQNCSLFRANFLITYKTIYFSCEIQSPLNHYLVFSKRMNVNMLFHNFASNDKDKHTAIHRYLFVHKADLFHFVTSHHLGTLKYEVRNKTLSLKRLNNRNPTDRVSVFRATSKLQPCQTMVIKNIHVFFPLNH